MGNQQLWILSDECWMVRKFGNSFHITSLFFRVPCSVLESSGPSAPASLRENSSYDVLCWATDAIGNDIMQSMVMLPLPWADTRDQLQMLQVKLWFVTYDFQRLSSWNPLSAIDIEDFGGHGKEFVERGWKGHRMDTEWITVGTLWHLVTWLCAEWSQERMWWPHWSTTRAFVVCRTARTARTAVRASGWSRFTFKFDLWDAVPQSQIPLGLYTAIYELNDVKCSQTRQEKCI